MRRFTNGELKYSPTDSKLRVLHAWRGKYRAGSYSIICSAHGIKPLTSNDSSWRDPIEGLADVCKRFLEENEIHPIFDAILIDEGQELVVDDKLKFEGKQPIYWLAYQALRPVDSSHPDQRRLIWAYDEAQNLTNLKTPSAKELFGESLSKLVSGQYPGGIRKSEIIYRSFRTPGQIITAAHAISMGLLRPDGMISGYTTQKDWSNIGYEVIKGNFLPGQEITLRRPPVNSPNRVPEMWDGSILEFNAFSSRQEELKALAESIQYNLTQDYLNPSRDILVIVLGSHKTYFKRLQINVAEYLMEQGIRIYIPSAPEHNILRFDSMQAKRNIFWCDGAVTVSGIYHAKGNEAYMVYVVGLDNVAMDESNANLRNQLFVALTRSMGWVKLSGVGEYPLYEEMRQVINSGNTLTFDFKRPPAHGSSDEDLSSEEETPDMS